MRDRRSSRRRCDLLLAHGADPTMTREPGGITCLHWVFHFDEIWINQASKALVKSGAVINARMTLDLLLFHYLLVLPAGTPMHWAVAAGQKVATEPLRLWCRSIYSQWVRSIRL